MGKTSESPPPMMFPTPQPEIDVAAMMAPMMAMMQSTAATQQQLLQQYSAPEAPQLPDYTPIDWTEKQSQLASKVKADFTAAQGKKKSRSATVLTSPLLDEEDAMTTESLIAGK